MGCTAAKTSPDALDILVGCRKNTSRPKTSIQELLDHDDHLRGDHCSDAAGRLHHSFAGAQGLECIRIWDASEKPGSTSSLGSTRAVQRAPKLSGDVTSSLGAARAREELPVLCDDLVVPENRECVLLVPKLDRDEVAINDHQGQQVFVAQRSEEDDSRIVLMSPTHEIFATVRTARASGGMAALAIHGAYEKEFGILKGMKGGDYELTGSGRRIRFQTSSGRLNIVDEDTRIMALSESERGRQFRIGPRVDVGLVICCVLGIDLLESDFR